MTLTRIGRSCYADAFHPFCGETHARSRPRHPQRHRGDRVRQREVRRRRPRGPHRGAGRGPAEGCARDRRARPPGAAGRRRQPLPYRAALRHGDLERRRFLQRHGLGRLWRHDHGDPVRGPASRPVDGPGGRRLSRAGEEGGDRPRLPHDRVRPERAGAGRAAGADQGRLLLAQAVHDLSAAEARRRADAGNTGAGAARARDGLGACRERCDDRLDGASACWRAATPRRAIMR